jgi:hypothetical protein
LVALDQPGRGAGDLINTAIPAWPHQQLEPCYEWNDIYTPTGIHLNMTQAVGAWAVLQEGRDFYNTPKPGYTPYVYPHPLAGNGPPPPPPNTSPCDQLQERLDRLQRRQQQLQQRNRSNKKLNRRIRRLQNQVQNCS